MTDITRRSFLKLSGSALAAPFVVAYELPPPPKHVIDTRRAQPITLRFLDTAGNVVGPSFEIPPGWWDVRGGVAYLRGQISVHDWSGPACTIGGIELQQNGRMLLRSSVNFSAPVVPGDFVHMTSFAMSMERASNGIIASAPHREAMLRAALGLSGGENA